MIALLLACSAPDALSAPDSGVAVGSPVDSPADSPVDSPVDTAAPPAGDRGLLIAQSWDRVDAPLGDGAGQYRVIVLQESMTSELERLRAANPDAVFLAYQKVGGMRADGGDNPSTGVQIGEADEAWFLHDDAGARLYYCDYPEVAAADIGNADYQARWLANVRERTERDGFDGVMMDDVNTFPGHCLGSKGTPLAEYADDEAYGDAVVAFMAAVGPALKADGLIVAPNIAMNPWDDTMRAQTVAMYPSITHQLREYWMRWDASPNFTGDNWLSTLTLFEEAEANGVGFMALTLGPGDEGPEAGQVYGRASFLLAWDGASDSSWGYLDDEVDPWSPVWEGDLGRPLGAREAVGAGWVRRYPGGRVYLNPDETSTVDFGDGVTLGPGQAQLPPAPGAQGPASGR